MAEGQVGGRVVGVREEIGLRVSVGEAVVGGQVGCCVVGGLMVGHCVVGGRVGGQVAIVTVLIAPVVSPITNRVVVVVIVWL